MLRPFIQWSPVALSRLYVFSAYLERFALLLSRWFALLVSFLVCSSAIRIKVTGILSAIPIQRTILLVFALLGACFAPPVFTALVLSFVVAWKPSILTVKVPFSFVCLNISLN